MSFMTFVSMVPLGKGESISRYVAKVVDTIDNSGLNYVVTPMGTVIEGKNWDEVMDVLKRGFERMREECSRISVSINVDYRKGKVGRMKAKIESLEGKLGKNLSKVN